MHAVCSAGESPKGRLYDETFMKADSVGGSSRSLNVLSPAAN